jgi:hypothetical protein
MPSRPMSGSMSGLMSGFEVNPTWIDLVPSITWTLNVGNVGFLQQERALENSRSLKAGSGLE